MQIQNKNNCFAVIDFKSFSNFINVETAFKLRLTIVIL